MSKGENIFKRKDGRWEARYMKGRDAAGKIQYGFCYGRTYKEAKEKVTRCKAAVAMGMEIIGRNKRQKFYVYCDEWLRVRKGRLKESTFVKYNTILEKHIKPNLGFCIPAYMTNDVIMDFVYTLQRDELLSTKTIKDILIVLQSVYKYVAKQYPGVFPLVDIVYPKEPRRKMRILSKEEQSQFVRFLLTDMDDCKFGVLLSLLTGMRIGELCALRWESINMEEKTIYISTTMQRLQNIKLEEEQDSKTKIVFGSPKSDTSIRTIPMTNNATELCRRMNPQCDAAYVLTGCEYYMEPRTLQYRLERYCKACGFEGVHFHTLRHTFATRCIEVGFEIKSLSEILGHSTTTITLDRYVHSSMELKRDNMNKLADIGL